MTRPCVNVVAMPRGPLPRQICVGESPCANAVGLQWRPTTSAPARTGTARASPRNETSRRNSTRTCRRSPPIATSFASRTGRYENMGLGGGGFAPGAEGRILRGGAPRKITHVNEQSCALCSEFSMLTWLLGSTSPFFGGIRPPWKTHLRRTHTLTTPDRRSRQGGPRS